MTLTALTRSVPGIHDLLDGFLLQEITGELAFAGEAGRIEICCIRGGEQYKVTRHSRLTDEAEAVSNESVRLLRFQAKKETFMHRTVVMLTITLVVGISAGFFGGKALVAQQAPVTRTILQQKDLEGVADREVIMFRAELAPGAALGRHYHPGPELFYILEGSVIFEPDGQPPVTLKAGDSAYNPAKFIHNAKNISTAEPAKLIGFWVPQKGQPLVTPVR